MKSKQTTQLTLYNIMFRQTSPPVPAFSETVRVNHFDAQSCSDILGLCIHYLDPDDEVRTAAEPRIVHGPETFDPAYRQTTLALRRKVQLWGTRRVLVWLRPQFRAQPKFESHWVHLSRNQKLEWLNYHLSVCCRYHEHRDPVCWDRSGLGVY